MDRILGGQQQPIDLVHVTQTKRPVAPGEPVVGAARNTTAAAAPRTAASRAGPAEGPTTTGFKHPNLQHCTGGTHSSGSSGGGSSVSGDWSCYCINIASCGASAYAVAAAPRWKVLGAWGEWPRGMDG